jgi:hypothetical protein
MLIGAAPSTRIFPYMWLKKPNTVLGITIAWIGIVRDGRRFLSAPISGS